MRLESPVSPRALSRTRERVGVRAVACPPKFLFLMSQKARRQRVYLIDTNVVSDGRKGKLANSGVRSFFTHAARQQTRLYLSFVTVGELRRGVELVRHRGDSIQAMKPENWLIGLLSDYADDILAFDHDAAQLWGRLRVPHHENAIDKQIAATALIHDLTLVTRNTVDSIGTGARCLDPFTLVS